MPKCATLLQAWQHTWQRSDLRRHTALQDATLSLAYPALYEQVARQAGQLRSAGIEPGHRIALSMERSLDAVLAVLAIMAAGACPCPLEPRLGEAELADRIVGGGLDWLLADNVLSLAPLPLPPERVLQHDRLPSAAPYWSTTTQPDDPALMLFTSGSTGMPKGVLQSHRGLLNNCLGVCHMTALSGDDLLLHVMPIYHTNGLNNQLFSPLAVGATVHFAPRFKAEQIPELMRQVKPTIITGVPTMYSRMLSHPIPPAGLERLRFARCGSAPITHELHRKIEQHLGRPLVISYGLSEATCTSTMNPPARTRIGSIGQVLANQDVYLAGPAGDRISIAGQEGEICIAGASLMLGYVGSVTPGALEPQAGPLHTGDIGYMDEDGYVFITGRIKDVIIRGGENISPSQIENVIAEHPGVSNCCVIGMPHEDLGEVPVAFILPQPGKTIDTPALQQRLQEKLARIYQPEALFVVDALPENSVGKVDRKALAARLRITNPTDIEPPCNMQAS